MAAVVEGGEKIDWRLALALTRERRRAGRFGAHALTLAFVALAVWCALVHPWPGAVFYLGFVAAFVALALAWGRLTRRALPAWLILGFVLANAILLTIVLLVPNPLDPQPWPAPMKLRPPAFPFFLLLVAWSTFTLSPRLVLGSGMIVVATWSTGIGLVALRPGTLLGFGLPGAEPAALARYLDPRFIDFAAPASNAFTAGLIAGILAVLVAHTRRLVEAQARVERARDNLARHVSANLVDELAEADEPFGPARVQDAVILFADVVGFTGLCEGLPPRAVMALLRSFHARMAECVFAHGGTLDKFVGDSVMATFGTPRPSARDASRALACARAMLAALKAWNVERDASREPAVRVGIGLHFGPVVLGYIGDPRRLEYAVLGDTVNIASRLEELTRSLETPLVCSGALIERVRDEAGESAVASMRRRSPIVVRGRTGSLEVWTLADPGRRPRCASSEEGSPAA